MLLKYGKQLVKLKKSTLFNVGRNKLSFSKSTKRIFMIETQRQHLHKEKMHLNQEMISHPPNSNRNRSRENNSLQNTTNFFTDNFHDTTVQQRLNNETILINKYRPQLNRSI